MRFPQNIHKQLMCSLLKILSCVVIGSLTVTWACISITAHGQYVEPSQRGTAGHIWSEWVGFDDAYTPEGTVDAPVPDVDHLFGPDTNIALLGNLFPTSLSQTGNPAAFITSGAGIYAPEGSGTSFIVYAEPTVTASGVLFQAQTASGSQSTPNPDTCEMFWRPDSSTAWTALDPSNVVASIDNNGLSYIAWEFDLSGLSVADFYIAFEYPERHSSLRGAVIDIYDTYSPEAALAGLTLDIEVNETFGQLWPIGDVTVSPSKPSYTPGESVMLTAVDINYDFVGWLGDVTGDTRSITFTITDDTTVIAAFAPVNYFFWKFNNFTDWHGGGAAPPDGDGDFEGDRLANWQDYGHGLDPEAVDDLPDLETGEQIIEVGGELHLALTFRRQPLAEDMEYVVSVSDNLETWLDNDSAGGPYTSEPEVLRQNANGSQLVRVYDLTPLSSASQRYIQLETRYTETSPSF